MRNRIFDRRLMSAEDGGGSGWEKINELSGSLNFDEIKKHVPEEYRSTLDPIKSIGGLLSSYANAQKALGKRAIDIPDERSTPEERAAFYGKLGVPEKPDAYELKYDDVKMPDDVINDIKKTFKDENLTTKQAQAVYKKFLDLDKNVQEKLRTDREALLKKEKTDWETSEADKLTESENAIKAILGKYPEAAKLLEETGASNRVVVRKMLKELASLAKDDNPNANGDKKSASAQETPQQTLDRLKNDKEFMAKYMKLDARYTRAEHEAAKKTMDSLYTAVYGIKS